METNEQSKEQAQTFTKESDPKISKLKQIRSNRKLRLGIIVALMALTGVLFLFFEKLRIFLIAIFLVLLATLGLEVSQTDFDLGKLMKTKSIQESKVLRDEKGNVLFDKFGNITTDSSIGKKSDDYNCADFTTQNEAQKFFVKVGGVGNDVNRLDGNKDGEACESLPKNE